MISCDTNILFPAIEASHPDHAAAREYLESQVDNAEFSVCELVLLEVYTLLRNPATSAKPLTGAEAAGKIQNLRQNPHWALLDYPGTLMDRIWERATRTDAFRRIYDVRLALTLRHHGVRRFGTANVKDFKDFGFEMVWNPLKE